MAKYVVQGLNQTVDLNSKNYITKGGEGSIHIVGDIVYKICEAGAMIPPEKLAELSVLNHKRIIRPERVLLNSKHVPCGYTMRRVPGNAVPLAQILSKTYREREQVSLSSMVDLVSQIAEGLRYIHSHPNYLQVDGNELNYMVTDDYKDVYFIDVNSFQTPNFPATAIMPSIRDYHCKKSPNDIYLWDQNTDWYSFAIISWYMFTGIHPFKGRHPQFTNLKTSMIDLMQNCKSVLDPEVSFPKAAVYYPFADVIPGGENGGFMQWYKAVFIENKRLPPPNDFQSKLTFAAKVVAISGSNNFEIKERRACSEEIIGFFSRLGKDIIVTKNYVYVSNQEYKKPASKIQVCFTPIMNAPVGVWLDNGVLNLMNLETMQKIENSLFGKIDDFMVCNGNLYLLINDIITEVEFMEYGNKILVSSKKAASAIQNATKLFQGVAFTDMFGSLMASIFPEFGHHRTFKLKELVNHTIVDAKFLSNVLMVIGVDRANGTYKRFVYKLSESDAEAYQLRIVDNINPSGLNFTVLPNGICVCINEEEVVEVFSNKHTSTDIKTVDDPSIKSNMRLCKSVSQVLFAFGNSMYTFSFKK